MFALNTTLIAIGDKLLFPNFSLSAQWGGLSETAAKRREKILFIDSFKLIQRATHPLICTLNYSDIKSVFGVSVVVVNSKFSIFRNHHLI